MWSAGGLAKACVYPSIHTRTHKRYLTHSLKMFPNTHTLFGRASLVTCTELQMFAALNDLAPLKGCPTICVVKTIFILLLSIISNIHRRNQTGTAGLSMYVLWFWFYHNIIIYASYICYEISILVEFHE